MLSAAEAQSAIERLSAEGIVFLDDSANGAGCAGPELTVLRFPGTVDVAELERQLEALLRA